MKPESRNELRNALAIVLAGALIGLVGALFLATFQLADTARLALIAIAEGSRVPGWLAAAVAASAGAGLAAWLAHRWADDAPQLSVAQHAGSEQSPTSNRGALSVNLAGTGLAVAAGFAVGPERPAIQMGGAIGRIVSRLTGISPSDRELLLAAAGGAGVATMFNSPMGCAAYTVEGVLRRVDHRITLTTLAVGAIAVAVTRILVGRDVNFVVGQMPTVPFEHLVLYVGLGAVIAVLGALQVHVILFLTRVFAGLSIPSAVRGAVIGGAIGLLAWYAPGLVGVGDSQTQAVLDGRFALSAMGALFLVRFFLGPLSLAAGTPGGYFTPVLLLGALSGAMYAMLIGSWLALPDLSPTAFALVGMAVALAAVAGAPFTGVLLVLETTGVFELALPMIIAVICSGLVTRLIRTPSLGHGLEVALAASRRRTEPQPQHQQP